MEYAVHAVGISENLVHAEKKRRAPIGVILCIRPIFVRSRNF